MSIIIIGIVIYVIAKSLIEYEPYHKRVERMDRDPNCNIKSNKWHREHDNMKG